MNRESVDRRRSILLGGGCVILLVILDQLLKYLAYTNLKDQSDYILIPGVFELEYLENRGAAFGILQNQQWLFILLFVVVLAAVAYAYVRIPLEKRYHPLLVLAVMLISGGLGNLIDRVFHGYVIDFFYFSLINFPIFNVADIYVTVSVFVLFGLMIFYYREEDLEYLMSVIHPGNKKGTSHGN